MQRNALAALDAARPAIARLDRSRTSDELAADLAEAWSGIETALRSLMGGTPLGGQSLIGEARRRQMITLDQANTLAEFNAARERAQTAGYHTSDADINAAREGFLKLEASLMTPAADAPPVQGEAMSTKGLRLSPLGTPQPVPMPAEPRSWMLPALIALGVIVLGGIAWAMFGRGRNDSLAQGVQYWQRGQRELAIGEFTKAAREDSKNALPHVYLSRLARESGNMTVAGQEAALAVQAEPSNATALREMGSYLLAAGNYELSRRFYVRALQAAPDDRTSQGFLGCALLKLGRYDEGMRWMNRAGTGSWSGCSAAQMPGIAPGALTNQPPPIR